MVSYEPSRVITFLPEILSALPLTLWVLVLTILFGSLLGLFWLGHSCQVKKAYPLLQEDMSLF